MGEVVSLAEQRPHISGRAKCLACKHEWVAVAPIGTSDLECPECATQRGVWAWPLAPADGPVWSCDCGSTHFLLTPRGAPMCVGCGARAFGWADS